jgi:hypothetical protein
LALEKVDELFDRLRSAIQSDLELLQLGGRYGGDFAGVRKGAGGDKDLARSFAYA